MDPTVPNAQMNPSRYVWPYFQMDMDVSWTLNSTFGTSILAGGVTNLLNTEPTKVYNGDLAGSDPTAYDFMGRFFYARVSHKF